MGSRLQAPGSSSVTKICGACLLVSGVLGLGLPAFGASIGYPIFVDFGDAATLQHFAAVWPLPLWFAVLAAMVPTLTLGSGLGFYHMLKHDGAIVVLGVVLLSLGLVFTVAQDGIEVTLRRVPPAGVRGRRSGSETRTAGDRRRRCDGHERLRRGLRYGGLCWDASDQLGDV